MATPTNKAEAVDEILDLLTSNINPSSAGRRTSIINDVCTLCNGPATEFRTELCRKEFSISGMCQTCQNETFGTD